VTTWTARVEWFGDDLTPAQVDDLTDRLAAHFPAFGAEEPGRLTAHLSVDAATLPDAVSTALAAVTSALHALHLPGPLAGIEVLDSPPTTSGPASPPSSATPRSPAPAASEPANSPPDPTSPGRRRHQRRTAPRTA
jgi:hypothetical protein